MACSLLILCQRLLVSCISNDYHANWAALVFGRLLFVLMSILVCWPVGFTAYCQVEQPTVGLCGLQLVVCITYMYWAT